MTGRAWLVSWAVIVLLQGLVPAAQAAPLFRKVLRINTGQVTGGPLTDFPLLFNSTDPALRTTANGGRVTNVNGWDIIFATSPTCADSTTCGGNKLDHEIESYNPVTGQLIAWVRVPSLDNGTVVYVHYADSAVVASTENRPGVWSIGYRGVWHLKETPAGVAGEVKDSTSNANNGTGDLAPNLPTQTPGQIAGSLAFDGTLDRSVLVPHNASLQLPTNMTVSAWARTTNVDGQARLIVTKWLTAGSMRNYWLGKLDASTVNFGVDGGLTVAAQLGLVSPDGLWHHVVGVADAAAPAQIRIYVDGNLRATNAYTGTSVTGTSDLRIGRSSDATLQDWDGGIDEVRVSSVARSTGWIATEHRNQRSPSTFYTLEGMRVLTGSYVGNGLGGRAITGLPFRPDVVLIASNELGLVADERQAVIRTSSMIGNVSRSIAFNTSTPLADRIQSLDAFGFTVGHPSPELAADRQTCVNHTGVTYYWTAFQAADGEMQVGTYPGNGLDFHNITGIGFQPDYVLVMSANTSAAVWQRSSAMAGDLSFALEGLSGANRIQALQADGFQLGTDGDVNQNGITFHYAAWKAVPGKMNVGSYTGNNADPRSFTGIGFRPEYVLMRRGQIDDSVMKPAATGSSTDWSLAFRCYANCGGANSIQALERDGFQVGNQTDVNLTGETYYWAAFGPHVESYYRSIGTVANYVTGTVSVTNGSTVVTGAGTAWKTANRGRGDRIRIGGVDYVVLWADSETQLRLTTPYAGATASGLGYTIARQFTTLQAWENCISFGVACPFFPVSSASLVADGRREVGIAYKDGVFTLAAPVDIDGSTTDAAHSITLTADPGNRHNGTAGAGIRINSNLGANELQVRDDNVTVEWLELFGLRGGVSAAEIRVIGPSAHDVLLQNLLVHDYFDATAGVDSTGIRLSGNAGKSVTVRNTMIWDGDDLGITGDELGDTLTIENCSVDWTHDAGAHGIATQLSSVTVRNTIATNNTSGDFFRNGGSFTGSNDTSADTSAATYFTSPQQAAAATLFVSSGVAGANLHLKAGANVAVDAGVSLSPAFGFDIDGQQRPAGAAWDRGADERDATTEVTLSSFVAVPGDASVVLDWRTASELNNLGFHLYRGPSDGGPWTRLTTSLIPGLGSSATGQAYSYRDAGLQNGTRYFYRLEDVDASSKTTSHGPVSAVPFGGAPGSEPPPSGPSGKKKGAISPSCPDWVVAAYGSMAGSSASSATLGCTRHGDPEAVSLGVVSRDSRQATLELRTGGFYALHTLPGAGEPAGTVRVFVPGFDFPQDGKAAALPVRRALTDAVVGRRVQLGGVRALDLVSFKGLVPSALGKPEMQVGQDGTVRAARRDSARAPRLFPKSELVTLLPSVFQGDKKSAVVEIAPLRFEAQRQQLVLAKRVLVRLLFTGRESGENGQGSRGRAPGSRKPVVSGEVLARLFTASRGLHSASFEQLFPGQRRGLAASQLRLERQGEPVGFHLEPASDAFGPGSRIFFYADRSAASTDFSAELAWELVRSTGGVVMPVQSAAPGSNAITTASIVSRAFETNKFYQPGLLDAPDPWLWEALASGATRVKSFALRGVSGIGTAQLDVDLQGASESGNPVDHHVNVSLNGTLVGEAQFVGKTPYRMSLSLPASLLREGSNDLQLTNVADTGVLSLVFLDRFSLAHPQLAAMTSELFEGTWAESGTATVAGLTGTAALVELPAEGNARWLSGYVASGGSVRFRAEAGRRYLVASQESLLAPRVAAVEPTTLRATMNQADYILVAPRAFLQAAEPLVERRQDQGLSTRAVAFEEIASEFGHGQASAEAIKAFLTYAFQSWTRPSPRYVLLLGDANYDPRNFMGSSGTSPLPALWTKTSYLWTVSDPQLAAVNGEDELPDLAIGRLPAASEEQAQALVQKLLAWEDSGQGLGGPAALVADNPDLAGDFEADVKDIAESYLSGRNPQLLLLSQLGPQMRPRILDALNGGLSFLSYVGHGGAAVWASENVWNSWDAPSLLAQSQQPFLVTMNCLNGYFVAPAFDSLSESLLKAEGRGAIAAFSPSGLSLDGPAHQYHRALMLELTGGHHVRLGDAILAAQKAYAEAGLMPELLGVYHLLGDPATKIR